MTTRIEEFRCALEGANCGSVLAQAYGYNGELVAPVTVVYLEIGLAEWARFGIDIGDFHWRRTARPEPIEGDGSGHSYPLVDVDPTGALKGKRILSVTFTRERPGGAHLSIGLAGGAVLKLVNANDESRISITGNAI